MRTKIKKDTSLRDYAALREEKILLLAMQDSMKQLSIWLWKFWKGRHKQMQSDLHWQSWQLHALSDSVAGNGLLRTGLQARHQTSNDLYMLRCQAFAQDLLYKLRELSMRLLLIGCSACSQVSFIWCCTVISELNMSSCSQKSFSQARLRNPRCIGLRPACKFVLDQ